MIKHQMNVFLFFNKSVKEFKIKDLIYITIEKTKKQKNIQTLSYYQYNGSRTIKNFF